MRAIWVCFDLSNTHYAHGYVWWFPSKQEATKWYKLYHKNPDYAELSKPVKLVVAPGYRVPKNARLPPCPEH